MSLFSAIHTYDSRISADGSFEREKEETMEKIINNAPFALVLVFLVIGFVLLIKGADFFVEGSSSVAKRLHVPSIIIGLTIVAMGTSLPETAVSVSASLAGNNELAVSNVVGSNIFNIMFILGLSSTVHPIASEPVAFMDILILIAMTTVIYVFCRIRSQMGRLMGSLCVAAYVIYSVYIIIR